MINSPSLSIIDVGHGNSAVLQDDSRTVVIDCGRSTTLQNFLDSQQISEIDSVILSHADADHIGGLVNLLSNKEIRIGTVYVNPDPSKGSMLYQAFLVALRDARQRGDVNVEVAVSTQQSGEVEVGQSTIEFLGPEPENLMSGAGNHDACGRMQSSNSLSVVVRIIHDGHPVALLPGDIDEIGLTNLLSNGKNIQSDILVFPHHGGSSGSNPMQFTRDITNATKPKITVFSTSRGRDGIPLQDIIDELRLNHGNTHMMCTQLNKRCSALPISNALSSLVGKGAPTNCTCAGTFDVALNGSATDYSSIISSHSNYISTHVTSPACR